MTFPSLKLHYASCGTCQSRLTIGGAGLTHYYIPVDAERFMGAIVNALDAIDCAQTYIAHPRSGKITKDDALGFMEDVRADLESLEQGEDAFRVDAATADDARIISAKAARGLYDLLAKFVLASPEADEDTRRVACGYQLALDTTRFMDEMNEALEQGRFNLSTELSEEQ